MSHEVESMFSVRAMPWHGLGRVIDRDVTDWEEARVLAGLDWEPRSETVYRRDEYGYSHAEGWQMIVRDDTDEVLSIQQDSYEIFGNRELGPLVEAIAGYDDVQYETAGVLRGGKQVWVMLRLKEPFHVNGDPNGLVLPYLAVQNSHDGSSSLRGQATSVRIVCANTSQMADAQAKKTGAKWAFRHTKNMRDSIEQAALAVRGLRAQREHYTEWANRLLGIHIDPQQEAEFIQLFFPEPEADIVSDRVRANIAAARAEFRGILSSETTESVRGTGYGLVQGATEYLDHLRGYQSKETLFRRTMLEPEKLKVRAEKLVLEVAR